MAACRAKSVAVGWRAGGQLTCPAGMLLVLLVILFSRAGMAQISPGALSKPHQSLSGPSGCTQCHAAFGGSPNYRCLECHQEIASRLREKAGLHPFYMGSSVSSIPCRRCHSEHNGEDFSLIKWDPTPGRFDSEHSKTGFPLDGKHAGLTCSKCHTPAKIQLPERGSIKNISRTFLGLSRACASCHEDKHKGQLGSNCLQCHAPAAWKGTFNHAKTRFVLTGAHVQVSCQKCHTPTRDGLPKYTGLKFDRCSSCHADVHRGAFPQACENCHTTGNWKQTAVLARFDHAKTQYPLLGKHQEVGCEACHRRADFKSPIPHQTCADCHQPDPHNGQFAKRADGGRCEPCHSVEGFKPAKFALAEHDATGFPLHGKHAAIACAKCHLPAGRATLYRLKFAQCTDCHQDAHRGQFAGAPYLNRCQQCHTDSEFRPSTFTLVRHQQGRFPLTGGHSAMACGDCHKPAAATSPAAYHFAGLTCTACHADPHRGEFAARMSKLGSHGDAAGCEACHSTRAWSDLSRFDHNSSGFILTGAHRAVECAACHRPPNLERKLLNVNFGTAPATCEGCHGDPHGAQFGPVTRCAECHSTTKWRPSLFDHEKTAFSLRGAHQNVRCSACHVAPRSVHGKSVLFYKPTPTACAACHANTIAGKE